MTLPIRTHQVPQAPGRLAQRGDSEASRPLAATPGWTRGATGSCWLAAYLLHLARMLKDSGGIPAHGNQRSEWDAGCRFDFDNPDYR
jgi:hypothetical protein